MVASPAAPGLQERFRSVMGRFATGVTIVSTRHLGEDAGMTVNAFLSVSLEPPTVLVSLSESAETTPLVQASRHFAVSLLSSGQRHLSERFASRRTSEEKFQGVAIHRGTTGAPLIDGALATLECEVAKEVPYSTHVLFLARVVSLEEGPQGLPLVFWRSTYATASQGDRLIMSPARPTTSPSKRPSPPRTGKRSP